MDWRKLALCAQVDTELFFPVTGDTQVSAKAVCRGCDVREECLEEALSAATHPSGIWGGRSESERKRIRKERAAA